ncbi:NACHT domain-containing protein [Streptomyces sp. SL13]|uniref:NACHT domain-containing protein n=1 Tax=Streptantibioticus silvisoli TaxID=2705255 RepID=A0AA90GXT9_9ACTN|nr:NACHT domain-containing protein [Streptantibioticus silvisoli]MDI5968376.1 NACHT domain-containing protein [Streptantibioticus silvisoli]
MRPPSKGALGGAANEAGSGHRAGAAALIVTYGLLGERVPWLRSTAAPLRILLEADESVDDIVVELADGAQALIQAKAGGSAKDLKDTVDQWCRAILSHECGAADELVMVVGSKAPLSILKLADALRQRRSGTSLTPSAQKLLTGLEAGARAEGLNPAQAALLLDIAKIKRLDADEDGDEEALGAACMNAAVVTAGHGMAAFRVLRSRLRAAARDRAPSDLAAWRQWLVEAKAPLVSDACGVIAARLQAEDDALAAYRERWRHRQDVMPLADLGMGLTSLHVPGLAADLSVTPGDGPQESNDSRNVGLLSVVRRQGRLLLVGRPGMGKTVALQLIAASWCAHPLAPVPIWLRLRDVEQLLAPAGPYSLGLGDLLRAAVDIDDPSLRTALIRRIEAGEAILLLDALDEVSERRDPVVEAVGELIARLPADLDVVVTSRHSSAAAASSLRLPTYELAEPRKLPQTLDRLLETIASTSGDPETGDRWLRICRQRVEKLRERERDLWSVPLLATLLMLTVAHRPDSAVPTSRAGLLTEVIDATVKRWEKRRRRMSVPGADHDLAPAILLDCYDEIAHLVASGKTRWSVVNDAVAERLGQHWGMSAGAAAACAVEIIDFWDMTAGIFITTSPRGDLHGRSRLFAEIGEARWVMRDTTGIAPWMAEALADVERRESVRLAASLSSSVADELIRQALGAGGDLLDLVHDARTDGVDFHQRDLDAYRYAQLDRLLTLEDRTPKGKGFQGFLARLGSTRPALLAVRLADDDLSDDQAQRLLDRSARLGPRQLAMVKAVCVRRQVRRRGTAWSEEELETLEAALLSMPDEYDSTPRLAGLEEVVRAAVAHLLPGRPEIAHRLKVVCQFTPGYIADWVRSELAHLGYEEIAVAMTPEWHRSLTSFFGSDTERARPFLLLAKVSQAPAALTASEAWHLNEAAAFVGSLDMGAAPATAPDRAVRDHEQLTLRLCRAALSGSGLPADIVAAQILSLNSEDGSDWGLLYSPSTRAPSPQICPSTIDQALLLDALHSGNEWLCDIGLSLAFAAQRVPDELVGLLVAALPDIDAHTRLVTAALVSTRWPDHVIDDSDASVRAGLARARAFELSARGLHRDAYPLLADPDLLVREEAVRFLHGMPEDVGALLEEALATPADQWTCRWCGTRQTPQEDTCLNRHPRPQVRLDPNVGAG